MLSFFKVLWVDSGELGASSLGESLEVAVRCRLRQQWSEGQTGWDSKMAHSPGPSTVVGSAGEVARVLTHGLLLGPEGLTTWQL